MGDTNLLTGATEIVEVLKTGLGLFQEFPINIFVTMGIVVAGVKLAPRLSRAFKR